MLPTADREIEIVHASRHGSARLPAKCGELFQGTLDGEGCLVSCPIARYGTAAVQLTSDPGWQLPPGRPKAGAALRAWLTRHQVSVTGHLELASDLPRGRGYGSSTVDVAATLFAIAEAVGAASSSDEIGRLAASIEPTDSTVFPGLALFAHRSGAWHDSLGPAPDLAVIVLDPGGDVDTVRFNQVDHRAALARLARDHAEALDLLRRALAAGDGEGIGAASSRSAEIHQALLADPLGPVAGRLAREVGAFGVCRAHSGTLWGLLVDPARADATSIANYVAKHVPKGIVVQSERLTNGGPRRQDLHEEAS